MSDGLLPIAVPMLTDLLLLTACLGVWRKLRRLGLHGVCEWTLTAMMVDAGAQMWHLLNHLGRAAGLAWLVHVSLSYIMVYVLYQLAQFLWRLHAGELKQVEKWKTGGSMARGGATNE